MDFTLIVISRLCPEQLAIDVKQIERAASKPCNQPTPAPCVDFAGSGEGIAVIESNKEGDEQDTQHVWQVGAVVVVPQVCHGDEGENCRQPIAIGEGGEKR